MVSFGSTGSADIMVCVAPIGRTLGLECKVPGRKQTAAQLVWAQDIQSKGGFAYRVEDLDTACEHVLAVYGQNLQLLRQAGQMSEEDVAEKRATATAQLTEAKRLAAEAEAGRRKRREHMPVRGKLPPGTNNQAGI